VLCGSIIIGCGKKDDPESTGGPGAVPTPDGQPLLRTRTAEDKKAAAERLKQIGMATHSYESAYGSLPAGIVGPKGELGLSWRVALLPFLKGEEKLYTEFKLDEPWDSEHNKKLIPKMPKMFEAPGTLVSNGKTHLRSFRGPHACIWSAPAGGAKELAPGVNQRFGKVAGRQFISFTDGTSNTLMVAEAAEAVEWTKPDELPFTDAPGGPPGPLPKLGLPSEGGFHGLMCDGAVHFFPDTLGEKNIRALISVDLGDVPGPEVTAILFPPKTGGPAINGPKSDPVTPSKGGIKKTYDAPGK
jgi:hypothetical protein